ncbi:hypothetical protein ABFA07_018230 [Porites harrisoni]
MAESEEETEEGFEATKGIKRKYDAENSDVSTDSDFERRAHSKKKNSPRGEREEENSDVSSNVSVSARRKKSHRKKKKSRKEKHGEGNFS